MHYRVLAGAAALALAAGSHAAVSASFAAGSANVDRIFELSQQSPFAGGGVGLPPTTIQTVDGVEVDLIFNMGQGLGLVTQRAGFEAMFYLNNNEPGPRGVDGPLALISTLQGSFRFFSAGSPDETLIAGFISDGVGVLVAGGLPPVGGNGTPPLIAGSLIAPGTSYFVNDPITGSSLGFPGGGLMGDAVFSLTDFIEEDGPFTGGDGEVVARATGSFSGTFIPSSGTGVLSALAMGVFAARRRR